MNFYVWLEFCDDINFTKDKIIEYFDWAEMEMLMKIAEKKKMKGADEKMNIDYYFYHCEVA